MPRDARAASCQCMANAGHASAGYKPAGPAEGARSKRLAGYPPRPHGGHAQKFFAREKNYVPVGWFSGRKTDFHGKCLRPGRTCLRIRKNGRILE